MARRSNTGFKQGLFGLVARLPWWLGVLLAVLSYLLFTAIAKQAPAPAGSRAIVTTVFVGFAGVLRYVVPLLCLFGAVASVWGRAQRKGLIDRASKDGAAAVAGMDWREFEMLVGEAFRQRGYSVTETGGGGADGGVDLALRRGQERALVQCKHWKTYRVGLPVVREMLGAMTAQRATHGWVISSGRFTAEARAFAGQHGIELVDGQALPALLAGARAVPQGREGRPGGAVRPTAPAPTSVEEAVPAAPRASAHAAPPNALSPLCPLCTKPMKERIASKGSRAGQGFWGCSDFPACRGTRPKAAVEQPGAGR